MRERIAELQTLLKDDGSLIINLPGWPTTSGIAGQFGIGDTSNASLRFGRLSKSLSATPRGYEKTLRSAGFTVIDCYTHLPTVANVQYSFNASSHEPIRWLTSRYRNHADIRYRIARRLSLVGDQTGLLKHCYPSYLVVASNDTSIDTRDSSLVESEDVILSHGRSRAALLHLESGSLEKVVKVPNRTRHGEISEREGRVLTSLKETQSSTTTNLPDGETIETRFGSARVEQPASGTPLSSRLDSCPETFRTVLEIGAEWITAFQRDYRCDESTLSVDDLAQQLTVEELEVSPPSIDSHSQLYYTPVHGDFHPQNIFANEDTVTTVIDWEHAVLRGNPLVDPTFFLLQVSRIIFGDLQTGFERIFLDDTEHASIAREYVESLCRDSGVDVETFLLHLPSGWIHQLGIEYEIGTSMTYTARPDEKREWVTFVWDHIDQINLDD
nr:aminoglycoside phosphotransferase family protein [Natronobiforma cellulositropha]